MAKLDLDDDNVFHMSATAEEVRKWVEGEETEHLQNVLDEAQAPVFGGERKTVYVVIEITGGTNG
jgi:hypothetical protein